MPEQTKDRLEQMTSNSRDYFEAAMQRARESVRRDEEQQRRREQQEQQRSR